MGGELRMGRAEWGLLLVLAAIWGSSFLFYKLMVADLPPMTIALGRTGIAALALNAVLRARGESLKVTRRDLGWFALCGVLNNALPFSLIAFGETRLSADLASILNATTPIFGILVAHALTATERLTAPRLAGVLLGFAGVAMLVGPGLFAGGTGGGGRLIGEAACLGSALCYAFGGVFSRRLAGHSALKIAAGQTTASAILLVSPVVLIDHPWTLPMPGTAALLSLAGIGLLCTAFAYVLYFQIMRVAGATNMMLVVLLVPVSALILNALFLGEALRPNAYEGMALIAFGLLAIDGQLIRRLRPA